MTNLKFAHDYSFPRSIERELRAAGTPGEFRLPRPPVRKKKAQTRGFTAKAGIVPGVPHTVGLRLISRGPRWTDQTIHRWRTLSPSPYLRWHAFQTKPPRRVLVTSGRLAGTMRLQPPRIRVRYARCPQPPFPIRMSNTPRDMPYLWIETRRNIVLVRGGSMAGTIFLLLNILHSSLPGLTRQSILSRCKVHGFTFLQANRAAHFMSV